MMRHGGGSCHGRAAGAIASVLVASACTGSIGDRMGPDGDLSPSGAPSATAISSGGGAAKCTAPPPIPRRFWRLSNAQYGAVVRDLLGLPTAPTVTGGGESSFAFFSGDSEVVSDVLAFSYAKAAEEVAGTVAPKNVALCAASENSDACASRFISTFLPRAFRRPVTDIEIAAMTDVYRAGSPEGYDGAIRLVIEATLQAPSFVYRTELGTPTGSDRATLGSFEIASELSFLFLDSLPDAPLWTAATTGDLGDPGALARQVDRLLALPAAQDNVTRIVLDWLGARQVMSKSKTQAGFTDDVKGDLVTESRLFLDDVLWKSQGAIGDLVTSNRTFLNARLAALYGLNPTGATATTFVPFAFPAAERAGILTQGSIMATHADVAETSVVLRGKFVRNEVVCLSPLPPPPAVASRPDIVAALAMAKTQRAKADYRAGNSLCAGCHAGMDPLGLAFEHYDAVGRFRSVDGSGQPIDASATLQSPSFDDDPNLDGRVDGAVDLATRLGRGSYLTSCAVQKIASYAVGRAMLAGSDEATSCQLDAIMQALPADRATIPELVRAIALSSMFQLRQLAGGM